MADLTSPPHFPFPAASPARRNSGGEDAFSRLVNFLRLTVELFLRIGYQNFWVNRAFRSFWLYGVTVFFAPFFLLVSYWSTVIILISFTAFARMAYYRYHIFISDSPLIVLHLVFLYFLTIADSGSILYLISPRYMLRVIDLILCQKVILFSDLFWVDVMTSIIKVVCRIVKSITPAIPYLIRTGLLLVQYRTFTVMKLFVVGFSAIIYIIEGWYLVAVSNALLRFTWTYKLFPSLKDSHSVEFVVTALEIWRRFIWCIFKVDQEWRQRQEQEQEQERGRG
ncbi:hypothetical protein Dsin_031655 [Dipteronia sinensis]|uniref:EXS domain-containing protein n=1 Tax=Dipteronia sinensis TaxID=43782 RepID=A0AAE0DSJ9_9ROSI|nr:hypothetical protein Dsin_031655 [Dipteronia sinensis]